VFEVLLGFDWSVLQQHLHSHRLSNQPNKMPSSNQNQQQEKVLSSELIFTPQ
jgi:hypothetical protein